MTAEVVMSDDDKQKIKEIKETFRGMLADEINIRNKAYGCDKIIYHEQILDRDNTIYSTGLRFDKSFVYEESSGIPLKSYLQMVIKQIVLSDELIPDNTNPNDMIHLIFNIAESSNDNNIELNFKYNILKVK